MERKKEMKTAVMIAILLMAMALMVYTPIDKAESLVDASITQKLRGETFSPLSAPPTEWNKTYGGANIDAAWSMIQTSDGGYALAGYTESFGAGGQDFWLVKTDSVGNMVWSQTYGGANNDEAFSVIQTSDGGYALAGYTQSFGAGGQDFWLVKTDSFGNMVWNQTYGGANNDEAWSVIQTSDGGYALAGVITLPDWSYDFLLIKIDSVGNIIWGKIYGGAYGDWALSMIQTSDGGYALAGYTQSFGAGGQDFWLVKTDSVGNMVWSQTYGGASDDWAWSVIQTSDGGYALAGMTKSFGAGLNDFWLVKTDSVGNMVWNKTYGGASDDWAFSVIQTNDGGYALAGLTQSFGAGGQDSWLIKTDSAGNMVWSQTYGGASGDAAFSVIQTSDGGYALAGGTASFGAGMVDFWLVKIAPEVHYEHDVTVTDIVLSKTVVGQGYNMNVNVTVANQGECTETFDVTLYADSGTPMNETGLVGYWNFDEGTGTIAHDSSGNNNDGTIYGATWTSGKYGNALQFDGIDDSVRIPDSAFLNIAGDKISITAWVKRLGSGTRNGIIVMKQAPPGAWDASYGVVISEGVINTGKIGLSLDTGWGWTDHWSNSVLNSNEWYHFCGTYDGSKVRIYLNGVLDAEYDVTGNIVPKSGPLSIGHEDAWDPEYFNGLIDEVKVYNRSLSAEEVWAEYTRTGGKFAIGTQTVTLESGASTTLTFTWNTTGFAKGNYTISAYAWPVSGETDIEDNTYSDGIVTIAMIGDLTGPNNWPDGKVDIRDVSSVARAFGSYIGHPLYNPNYDIIYDGKIDMKDISTVARNFGKIDP
jgi:hypothetical protein